MVEYRTQKVSIAPHEQFYQYFHMNFNIIITEILITMQDKIQSAIEDPCRIIIVGLPYSGKDEVAKILAE